MEQRRRQRPTGDADDPAYKGAGTWTRKRWAWEFLRRNKDFIACCQRVDAGKADENEVAARFGLRKFKHAREPYAAGPPKFTAATITTKLRAKESDPEEYRRTLKPGEMVVVIRLEPCLRNPAALDSQLRALERSASRRLKLLARDRGVTVPAPRVTKMEDWLYYLRILDLLATGASQDDVARKIYPSMFKDDASRDERRNYVRGRIDGARSFADSRYLDVAVADSEAFRARAVEHRERLQAGRDRGRREQ